MPHFNIVRKSEYKKTFRTESIKGQFDLKIDSVVEQFTGNIDIENKDWKIGVIVGSSGSGKSTIAKELFNDFYINELNYGSNSIIDEMPENKSTEEITSTFNSVGFGTIWSWLKPYSVLSNGEKMRVDLAKSLLSDNKLIVFDEFTSVVDRTIAKTSSFAISKAIRKSDKQFVAVSCHYDIIDWIEPDWIYDTNKKEFFFAQKNIQGQKLNWKSIDVQQKNGKYLKSIII